MSDDDVDADRETVELRERVFQRYAIENRIYFIPVDEVSYCCSCSRRMSSGWQNHVHRALQHRVSFVTC